MQLSTGEVEEVERKQEEVQELHLTDDLADSLMNPPTEPEQSDEEPNICAHVEMKTETEEVLLEDQEVQGITEAVEELAKNKVSQESSQLSEEVEVIRESSPLLTSSHIEDKVSSTKASPMPETLVMEDEHCEKTERATLAADVVEKETILQETQLMEVDTVKEETVVEEAVSEYYKIGDIIDGKDVGETGAWFEGKISKITKEVGGKVVAGKDGLTYYVKYDSYPDDDDSKCKIEDIRPRARRTYKLDELEEGMKVMVNYNVEKPDKRGGWYDAEITKVNKKAKTKKAVTAMVFAGADSFPVPDCDILFFDEVMRCEEPVKLSERDDELEKELNTPVERKNPFKCDVCQDNGRRKCKDCGCSMCGTKDDPANTILCDECDSGFCLKCLKLKEMPEEEEWFCPDCKTVDDIVKKGEKMKASKKKANHFCLGRSPLDGTNEKFSRRHCWGYGGSLT